MKESLILSPTTKFKHNGKISVDEGAFLYDYSRIMNGAIEMAPKIRLWKNLSDIA